MGNGTLTSTFDLQAPHFNETNILTWIVNLLTWVHFSMTGGNASDEFESLEEEALHLVGLLDSPWVYEVKENVAGLPFSAFSKGVHNPFDGIGLQVDQSGGAYENISLAESFF